jgi:hypothetical protein
MTARTKEQLAAMKNRRKRRSPRWPGYTIPQFSRLPEVVASEAMVRSAVEAKLIDCIEFNNVKLIPTRERAKWKEMWGEPPSTTDAQS